MPIQVVCSGCKKTLRVADKHAGKRAKCPNCQQVIDIPAAAGSDESPAAPQKHEPESSTPQQAPASSDQWYVQTDSGEQFGPISKQELDSWVGEGRLDSTCQVLNEQWDQWKWAEEVYPQLAHSAATEDGESAATVPATTAMPAIATSEKKRGPAVLTAEVNPFASPKYVGESHEAGADGLTPRAKRSLEETRPWVFLFSILAFVGCGFAALGGASVFVGGILQGGAAGAASLITGVLLLGSATLYGFAAYHLYSYASYIKLFLKTSSPADLEQALTSQKSFWKLVGIVTAIFLVLYGLLLIMMLVSLAAG